MEGDASCPREQPWDHTGWEMAGEGRRGNLSLLVPLPLVCRLKGAAAPRRVSSRSRSSGDEKDVPGASCGVHLLFLDPSRGSGHAAWAR